MNLRERHYVGWGIVLLTAVASALAYPEMPAEMATRWSSEGTTGTTDRTVALAGLPALAAALLVVFEAVPRIDPLGEHIRDLGRYYDLLVLVIVGMVAYAHGLIILWNLGTEFDVVQAIAPAVAVVYYVAGAIMEQVDKNWFVGVRTPWTLSDDRVWEQTHERAGVLFKVAGVAALGAVAFSGYGVFFLAGPVLAAVVYLTVYSYVAYSRLPDAGDELA